MSKRNAYLSDAIDSYLAFLAARQLAENSIKASTYTLKGALSLWGNLLVKNIEPRHIDILFAAKQWGPRTHNTNLQIVKQFFGWCRNQGYMSADNDPTFGWRNRKVPNDEQLRIPVERFADLLDAATHPRDRAQIAVGLFLFLRGSEAVLLTIENLDFSRHTVDVYRPKTKEYDTLPMCEELEDELLRFLHWYKRKHGPLQPDWYLLPATCHVSGAGQVNPQIRQQVLDDRELRPRNKQTKPYMVAQRAIARLGYDTARTGEHTLRRSGARAYADQLRHTGYDGALLRVASMLGHKDTKQTEHYIGWHLEKQQRNEALAGKSMFDGLISKGQNNVINLRGRESNG